MTRENAPPRGRGEAYGQHGLTPVDRFGVMLSRRPIMRVVRRHRCPTVLDIGCGYNAPLLRELLPLIAEGVGIDVAISPDARAERRLAFYEQPAAQVLASLPPRRFDIVLLVSVLEHLRDPQAILQTCFALLEPGGSLVVNVPTWRGKPFLEFSAFRLKWSPAIEMDDHKMYYDKRDLWPLLVRAGFRPSDVQLRYHKFGLNLFAVATKREGQRLDGP